MPSDVEAACSFVDELLTTHKVSDTTLQTAKYRFGEKGVVDMMGGHGECGIVSFALKSIATLASNLRPELNPVEK